MNKKQNIYKNGITKKKSISKAKTCLIFLFWANQIWSQIETWSLQKCLEWGIQNNLELKIKNIEQKKTEIVKTSGWNTLIPSISFNGSHTYNFGSTIDPATNARISSQLQFDNFFFNASLNLLDFSELATAKLTTLQNERAIAMVAVLENEYKLQVLESFFTAFYAQELTQIQKTQLKNAKENVDRVAKEVTIGNKPKSDYYDMQLQFALEEKNFLETVQLFEKQRKQLFQLINYDSDSSQILLVFDGIQLQSNQNNKVNNPKIKLAQIDFERAMTAIQVEKGINLPKVTSFYTLSSFYFKSLSQENQILANFWNQLDTNKNHQLGLQVAIPVFNGFRNSRRVRSLQLEVKQANEQVNFESLKVNQQIALEELTINQLHVLDTKLKEVNRLAHQSFTTSQAKFTAGKIDATTLSIIKNQLLQTEYEILKNKLQIHFTEMKIIMLKN